MKSGEKKLFLIDGNAFCYRAFYAIRHLTNSKGMPTNAIYGVINMMNRIIAEKKPDLIGVVFDVKGPTSRHEKYAAYKEHRKPMPDDLSVQMPKIKDVIRANNIAVCEMKGYEADDVIATLASKAVKEGFKVVIVTSDKDALQLVDDNVSVLNPDLKKNMEYGREEVYEKFGVYPEGITEYMALTGDASDNVPGVKGIGKVAAQKLIEKYGTIEKIYNEIDSLEPSSLKDKIKNGKESAYLSKDLVILEKDLDIDFTPDKFEMKEPDSDKLAELYKEFEFRGLLKKTAPVKKRENKHVTVTSDMSDEIREVIRKEKICSLSILTGGNGSSIKGIAFAAGKDKTYYAPFDGKTNIDLVKKILADKNIQKAGYDIKKDIRIFRALGIEVHNYSWDVLIADYILQPTLSSHDLEGIAIRWLGCGLYDDKTSGILEEGGQIAMDFSDESSIKCITSKASGILSLKCILDPEMENRGLKKLFDEIEMPLVEVIASIEDEGIGIDIPAIKKMSKVIDEKLESVMENIFKEAGEEFNINSPKQLGSILFDKLGLPVIKKGKTGPSTNESVLKVLAKMHSIPELILEYRELNKLKTTYYDVIERMADKKTGRLHTTLNQAVTATGRLSSSEPNLQNIPVKTELGREIRRAFIPWGKNNVLIAGDYSQIELRILAHLSGDKKLIEAFKNDEDIHRFTAAEIFGVKPKDVTDDMRSSAKTVNFGVIYGMGAFSLSKDLGITVTEAQNFIDAYFKKYSGVKDFIEKTLASAKKDKYVSTILGRRRFIPEISSKNMQMRSFAERTAINTPVQGSAADIIKLAMIECFRRKGQSAMVLQIHDELMFVCPENMAASEGREIRRVMENVISLKVPLKVNMESGPNWLDMEDIG